MDSYLQGTWLNIFGRPISSENVTVVPVGPMVHLIVLAASATALAALPCTKKKGKKKQKKKKKTKSE